MRSQVCSALVGLLALSTTGSAAMWRTKPGWANTKILLGVSAVGSDEIFLAGSDDRNSRWEDMARVIHSKDRGETYDYLATPSDHSTFFHFSIAYKNSTSGVSTGTAPFGSPHLYTVDGKTLKLATTETESATCQSIERLPGVPDGYAATGSFNSVPGLHVTLDGGATWSSKDWGYSGARARYGAFPAADAWYIAGGRWSSFAKLAEGHMFENLVLERGDAGRKSSSEWRFVKPAENADNADNGYVSVILKSTDQGATWTVQHETTGVANGYFNQIACATKDRCIAVNEGRSNCRIYATTDGGAAWNKVYEAQRCSLMAASCVSPTTCYAGGMTTSDYHALVLGTEDFGKTWTATAATEMHAIMDLDMVSAKLGYAAAANVAGGSSLLVLS